MFSEFKKLNKNILDKITIYRLYNAFYWAFCSNLIIPLLVNLKGQLLVAWVIACFMIAEQLALKTNRYLTNKFTIADLYKIGIFLHIAFMCSSLLYFYDKTIMIIIDSTIAILDFAVFSALSIKLNNYLVNNYPETNNDFQIIRNSIWVDGVLLGLGISTIILYFFTNEALIITFIIFNFLFNLHMIKNWRIYDGK